VVRIRAGLLDGELKAKPVCHFYVANKANWLEINDDLAQYSGAYKP